jgi:hypothetical protein
MPFDRFDIPVVAGISAMVAGFAISSAAAQSTETAPTEVPLKVVELICPGDNARTLELTAKSSIGQIFTVRVRFRSVEGEGEAVAVDIHMKGQSPERVSIDLLKELSDADKVTAGKALKITGPMMRRVCNGPTENKEKFSRWMEKNRAELLAD